MDRTESIRSQFSAAADRYTTSRYHSDSPDLAAMLEAVALRGDERILDLGTGAGHTAVAFAPHVAEVVALDLTPAMLDEARGLAAARDLKNIAFELGDALSLPFPDDAFDGIVCRVCAHHFESIPPALSEAARVLRAGGFLILVDSVSPEDPAQDTFLNCIELLRDPSHVRNYRVSEWQAMLREAGFGSEPKGLWPVWLPFEDWVERMRTPEPERGQLLRLFDGATDAIREAFEIGAHGGPGFSIPIGMIVARLG